MIAVVHGRFAEICPNLTVSVSARCVKLSIVARAYAYPIQHLEFL